MTSNKSEFVQYWRDYKGVWRERQPMPWNPLGLKMTAKSTIVRPEIAELLESDLAIEKILRPSEV